jgi:hypothetical protein
MHHVSIFSVTYIQMVYMGSEESFIIRNFVAYTIRLT